MIRINLALIITLIMTFGVSAQNNPDTDKKRKKIDLTTVSSPHPHYADVSPPVAMYNTVTEELSVTLDAVHYSDYTITLVSDLIEVDYYPFSPLVCLPTASMGDVVTTTSCLF